MRFICMIPQIPLVIRLIMWQKDNFAVDRNYRDVYAENAGGHTKSRWIVIFLDSNNIQPDSGSTRPG